MPEKDKGTPGKFSKPGQNKPAPQPPTGSDDDMQIDTLAETENYVAWVSHEPDGEVVFHLEVGAVTLHMYQEEFDELVDLIMEASEADAE